MSVRHAITRLGLLLLVASAPLRAADVEEIRERAIRAFAADDFQAALDAYGELDEDQRHDPFILYNMACAHAMLDQPEQAAERLLDALSWGFVDLFHMERDAQLASLREGTTYRTILRGWNELLQARADADMQVLRARFEDGYTFARDEALRLSYASAFDEATHADAIAQIEGVAGWVDETGIFALRDADPSMERQDPWVTVVLPTREDFIRLVPSARVGGFYERDRKRLVSQDVGPSLRHEFFHVLHWRHMDRIGQTHPLWIQEGLASLFEDVDGEPGDWTFTPSWRTNIVKRIDRTGRLYPWKTFFAMPDQRFMGVRPSANYAYARTVFLFLASRGVLIPWYRTYIDGFDTDPSGLTAMETVFDKPVREIERDFRTWVRDLESVGEVGRPGEAGLGLQVGTGTGEGPVVTQVVAGSVRESSPEGDDRLRHRDVITAIDGRTVRTLDDLYRVLGEYEVGDDVTVTVRRGDRRLDILVRLVPAEDDETFP
ncbi:MAG: PDZ domain-containing protein [Phycisphaerales bacterium]|nr:PDZ domain-containing protein [Phycisphaerales bacterium]